MPRRIFKLMVILAIAVTGGSLLNGLVSAEDYSDEVTSGEILSQIRDGKAVEYQNVKIVGELDLGDLDRAVQSPIEIVNCMVQGPVYMENQVFAAPVSFAYTTFDDMALFSGAKFNDSADFTETHFEDTVFFDSAEFGGVASFRGAHFGRDAWFSEAVFHRRGDFNFTRFSDEYALFDNVQFLGNAHFEDAQFGRWTNFYGANFSEDADFLLATFPGRSFFSNVWFGGLAKFAGVEFLSFAEFENYHFEGDFFLYGSTISYMKLNGSTFGEKSMVHLNNTEINGFIMPWQTIKDHLVSRDEVYMGLVQNYKQLGWFQDADQCYYHYRKLAQDRKEMGWSKALDYLAWVSCGYGVRPDYTFVWSLSIILLFGIIFYMGKGLPQYDRPSERVEVNNKHVRISEVHDAARDRNLAEGKNESNFDSHLPESHYPSLGEAIYFSSLVFIAQGPADYLAQGRYKYLVILEGTLGWLILALFLVALGNLMIR